ncbi:response regulator [Portibacter marinus]|uniref:response regulator n=1 Tax=Portibacter marinus TaxID=2898660 RepID=UPI001F325C96|nr:response regulator [Portibacter marinus]
MTSYFKRNVILWALLILPFHCDAGIPTIELFSPIDSFIEISDFAQVYVEPKGHSDWNEVYQNIQGSETYRTDDLPNFGKFNQSRYAYWVYFKINTSTSFPSSHYYLKTKSRGLMQLFQIHEDELVHSAKSGFYVKRSEHPKHVNMNDKFALPFKLEPGSNYEFLLHLESTVNFNKNFDIALYAEDYNDSGNRSYRVAAYFILGGFLVTLTIIALLAFSIFIYNKERAFLFYALYIAAIVAFYVRLYSMQNPDWFILPHYLHYYWVYLPILFASYFAYSFFIMYFLETRKKYPKFHKLIKYFLWSLIAVFTIDRILILVDTNWSYRFIYFSRYVIHLCTVLFLLYLLTIHKNKLVWFIVSGTSILLFSLLVSQSLSYQKVFMAGFLDSSDIPMMVGILLEIFCLFLGLGYKSKLVEKEKNKAMSTLQLIEQKSKYLQEMNEMRNHLYTGITHEFRTPLTLILGLSEKLKVNSNGINNKQDLQMIHRNGKQLLDLINKILEVSKIDENGIQPHYGNGNIATYIRYLVDSLSSLGHRKNIEVVFYSEQDEIYMDYDREMICTIIENLIANAVKFSPKDSRIIIHLKAQEEKALTINVKDRGIGISEKDLPFVFDKYFRVEQKKLTTGTGLGLSLVKSYVETLGGKIQVKSKLGIGSVFTVSLPIRNESELLFDEAALDETSPTSLAKPIHSSFMMQEDQPCILVVEDSEDVTYFVAQCLNEYSVIFAKNGREGLSKIKEMKPDLIISDIMMPIMDGIEFCKEVKTNTSTSDIPIILLTAKTKDSDRLFAYTQGADAYISKPFSKVELLTRVKQLIASTKRYKAQKDPLLRKFNKDKVNDDDSMFLQKAVKVIRDNLDNHVFGPPLFAKLMGMSDSLLYKKLKGISGKSTALFIRSVRLDHARSLLMKTHLNVSEVARNCGFKDVSWFSRAFKKEFGYSPSEIKTEH